MTATTETEPYEPNPLNPPAWTELYRLIHEIGSGWDPDQRDRFDNAVGDLHRETERMTRQRQGTVILETIQGHRYQDPGCMPEYPMWTEEGVGIAGLEARLAGVESRIEMISEAVGKLIGLAEGEAS